MNPVRQSMVLPMVSHLWLLVAMAMSSCLPADSSQLDIRNSRRACRAILDAVKKVDHYLPPKVDYDPNAQRKVVSIVRENPEKSYGKFHTLYDGYKQEMTIFNAYKGSDKDSPHGSHVLFNDILTYNRLLNPTGDGSDWVVPSVISHDNVVNRPTRQVITDFSERGNGMLFPTSVFPSHPLFKEILMTKNSNGMLMARLISDLNQMQRARFQISSIKIFHLLDTQPLPIYNLSFYIRKFRSKGE